MNQLKRVVSFLLCLVMVVGFLPAGVLAASYNVGGTDYVVDDPAVSDQVTTSTTTTETKSVYVLVNTISEAGNYLIASGNSGSVNLLTASSNGVTNTSGVAVTTGTNSNGESVTYIETATAAAVWTAASSNSGYTLKDTGNNRYLRYNNSLSTSGNNSTTWTAGTNTLTCNSNGTRYLTYNSSTNSNWSTSSSSANVYFFKQQDVDFATTTQATGVYSLSLDKAEITKVAKSGASILDDINVDLVFTTTDGKVTSQAVTPSKMEVVQGDAILNGSTYTGSTGSALVKVSYDVTVNDVTYTLTNYVVVNVVEPYYTIDIVDSEGTSITGTVAIKGADAVAAGYDLSALVTYVTADGSETIDPDATNMTWQSGNTNIATVADGKVTFTGNEGTVTITVYYEYADGLKATDTVTFNVTKSSYTTPSDGTDDFPEYPNEGAIRIDKTAQAVGNFSSTGIAQVELAMTGVPYSVGNEIDVVIMIDMSTSMTKNTNGVADRVTPARNAALDALEAIVKNEDGTINGNRVAIYTFNGYDQNSTTQNYANAVDEVLSMQTYKGTTDADTSKLDSALEDIEDWIVESNTGSGTNYGAALEKCYSVLNDAREEYPDRKQYVIFVTDGEPTTGFAYVNDQGGVSDDGYNSQYSNGAADKYYTYTEYYSTQMKNAGVEVYSVGIQLDNDNANTILKKIAGNKSGNAYTGGTDYTKYAQFISADGDVDDLVEIFQNIVNETKQAATNVTVEDKIADEYSMIFELPNSNISTTQEFYIQVAQYTLDADKERSGDPTILEKFTYTNGAWVHTVGGTACGDTCTHVTGSGNNVTAIDGTYFDYTSDENGEVITWTAEKLDTTELALQYFVYLDNSAGVDADKQVAAGTYPTNEYATINYTNYRDVECQKTFPVPQLTWNGAQVTYVFYLVNENGEPVNRAGKVVPFAEAVYVTDPVTYAVTWNKDGTEGTNSLNASYLANQIVPDVYALYDSSASYEIHVFETEATDGVTGKSNTWFAIDGGETNGSTSSTTKVYNTKAGTKYSAYGTYYSNNLSGFDFANTTVAFAVVWKPELVEDTVVIDFGLPVVIDVTTNDALASGVVGVRATAPANVAINKGQYTSDKATTVTGGTDGLWTASVESLTSVRFVMNKMGISEPVTFYYESDVNYYSGSTLKTTSMYSSVTVIPATTVYYEDSFVEFQDFEWDYTANDWTEDTDGGWAQEGTTVSATQAQDRPGESNISKDLDADNNYGYDAAYETMSNYSMGSAMRINVDYDHYGTASFKFSGTGFDLISLTSNKTGGIFVTVTDAAGNTVKNLTVDSYYGYTYANGEWKLTSSDDVNALYQVPVIEVSGLTYGTYTVTIDVAYNGYFEHKQYVETDAEKGIVYRANKNGRYALITAIATANEDGTTTYTDRLGNAMTAEEFDNVTGSYDKVTEIGNQTIYRSFDPYWTVNNGDAVVYEKNGVYTDVNGNTLTALEMELITTDVALDCTTSYDFYVDAIRIYDPVDPSNGDANDAYVEDEEGYPIYAELRNLIIDAKSFTAIVNDAEVVTGAVFIDGKSENVTIAEYVSYGPNNEVYLAKDQAIAFNFNTDGYTADGVTTSFKDASGNSIIADVQLGIKTTGGETTYKIYSTDGSTDAKNVADKTIASATDLYYSIKDLTNGTIVITNTGDGILSITNIKVTFTQKPTVTTATVEETETTANGAKSIGTVSAGSIGQNLIAAANDTSDLGLIYITAEAANYAVQSLAQPVLPETFEPETMDIRVLAKTVAQGKKLPVMITTSDDVDSITVNGVTYTKFVENKRTGLRTWKVMLTADKAGTMQIEVVAINADGIASEPVSTSVRVIGSRFHDRFVRFM